jgi:hypothetical protein
MAKRYVRYNKTTGKITAVCTKNPNSVANFYDEHDAFLPVSQQVLNEVGLTHRVNLNTLQLEPIPDARGFITDFRDIKAAIQRGDPDEHVDILIRYYMEDHGEKLSLSEFKKKMYHKLRRFAYPPLEDYIDAQVHMNILGSESKGREQMREYIRKCLEVKERFRKE